MRDYSYASLGKRALSFFIDDIIVSLIFIVIFYEQISTLVTPDAMLAFIKSYSWVLLLLKLIYHTFFIALNGATIGKYFAKIRAIDEESGSILDWPKAFLRASVRVVGEFLFYITFIVAFLDSKRQTLHDKISKCVVIDVKN